MAVKSHLLSLFTLVSSLPCSSLKSINPFLLSILHHSRRSFMVYSSFHLSLAGIFNFFVPMSIFYTHPATPQIISSSYQRRSFSTIYWCRCPMSMECTTLCSDLLTLNYTLFHFSQAPHPHASFLTFCGKFYLLFLGKRSGRNCFLMHVCLCSTRLYVRSCRHWLSLSLHWLLLSRIKTLSNFSH